MRNDPLHQKRLCAIYETSRRSAQVYLLGFKRFKETSNEIPRYDGPPALTKYDIQETKIEVRPFLLQASNLPQGGGARGGRGDPSDDHSWSKTSWRPPQRLCPYHHPQPDQFQYQLLQGDFSIVCWSSLNLCLKL